MQNKNYKRRDVSFNADGVELKGWLYLPTNQSSKVPAIVMSHGYNCIKELYLDKFAEVFAENGFAVLAYDNRNLGESGGEIRQELDPWQQINDYRHAITFMQTQDIVDAEKIGIWGTSYTGGHVLVVAAIDKRVKAVVSQVPTISGWRGMLRRIHPDAWDKLIQDFNEDRKDRYLGKTPKLVPMIQSPDENQFVSHATRDAWDFFTGKNAPAEDQWRFDKWRNEVTLRSIEMYSEYEPGAYIERIAPTPLLMLVAEKDFVAVTDEALEAFNRAREIKKLHIFPGGHFSAYLEQFESLSTMAADWFNQFLKHNN